MIKTKVFDNLSGFDVLETANNNSLSSSDSCENNIISLSHYRERIKSKISTDKTPLPPCALAKAA